MKVYSPTEIVECLMYMDMYPATGQHREGAEIIRQLMRTIDAIESDSETRIEAALRHLRHVEGTQQ